MDNQDLTNGVEPLIAGFKKFQNDYFSSQDGLFDELQTGQKPKTLLIGCSDSRVDPALLLGARPGELFVVRNVANLVPPCEGATSYHGVSAAIQFAVLSLEVSHIIVLGHAHCGGIRSLLEHAERPLSDHDFIGHWINIAAPAVNHVAHLEPKYRQCACEQAAILISLANLMTFPWVASRVANAQLHLHGWYFDLKNGALLAHSASAEAFVPIVPGLIERQMDMQNE